MTVKHAWPSRGSTWRAIGPVGSGTEQLMRRVLVEECGLDIVVSTLSIDVMSPLEFMQHLGRDESPRRAVASAA